ncbi:hypothetical protein JCM8547_009362 [Rhodosporidiobolus lusitaniae]
MSRYAQRLDPSSAYGRQNGYYRYNEPEDDGEDDETAVATDLSLQQRQQYGPQRRGIRFGENVTEEFNGSEAPDMVRPVSSMGQSRSSRPPQQQQQQQHYSNLVSNGGIGRPRSTSMDGRRLPPAMAMEVSPPPPSYPPPPPSRPTYDPRSGSYNGSTSSRREVSDSGFFPPSRPSAGADRGYGRPVSFARGGYDDDYDQPLDDDGMDDDDDDAFTAVGTGVSMAATGVATDLSLDNDFPRRGGEPVDARMRMLQQQREQSGFLAVARPPSRSGERAGPQVYRASPVPPPPPQPQYSASGYQASDFSMEGEDDGGAYGLMPPPPVPRRLPSSSPQTLAPLPSSRALSRPASTGSMRMLMDEDGEGGLPPRGIGRQGTPKGMVQQQVQMQARQTVQYQSQHQQGPTGNEVPADSPVEKELIALLKELRFSIALKDFHDTMQIGVQKTLVAEDGMGHAYCKVHCKKLPRHEAIAKEAHLRQHWIPIAGSRWEFRTASHRVTVVFKSAALAAYEAQFLTSRR